MLRPALRGMFHEQQGAADIPPKLVDTGETLRPPQHAEITISIWHTHRLLTLAEPPVCTSRSMQVLSLQSSSTGLRYIITCTVSKGDRASSASGYLIVRSSPSIPVVSVDGLPDDQNNPDARLVLSGTVQSVFPDTLQTAWVQTDGPPIDLTDPAVRDHMPYQASENFRLRPIVSSI